ncbi:MAG: hypothetical protein HS130_00995 [Deltaproteobacteria bacterium]|nr:hypothetical protein [Deltaproteobacteria bacterium]
MTRIEAIEAFCEKEQDRYPGRDLSRPWLHDGNVHATNWHALIKVSIYEIEGHPYQPWDASERGVPGLSAPDYDRVIPEFLMFAPFPATLIAAALASTEPKSRVVPETEPCDECQGKGNWYDDEEDEDVDCTNCDGEGILKNENAGETELSSRPRRSSAGIQLAPLRRGKGRLWTRSAASGA